MEQINLLIKFIVLCIAVRASRAETNTDTKISGVFLVRTDTDEDIKQLSGNEIINLVDYPTTELTVRAEVSGSPSRVIFVLNGVETASESQAPFSANGDHEGDFFALNVLQRTGQIAVNISALEGGTMADQESLTLSVIAPPKKSEDPVERVASDVPAYPTSPGGSVSGDLRVWHKVTLGFEGPPTSETANPNPFVDYRLNVEFTSQGSLFSYEVPGYYAGDGDAANSGSEGGNVWLVHFAPHIAGPWTWRASFTKGDRVALYENGPSTSAGHFDGKEGTFTVLPTDKTGRDHRGKGRLSYVGNHFLQYAGTEEHFLKVGVDSPENFLAYEDFDNTPNYGDRQKTWASHQQDYQEQDKTWKGGRGSEIMGAINYLSSNGLNAFSFLTMNIEGEDENVFPYISDSPGIDRLRIDNSKMAQWEVVFEHADKMGMFLHFKTQETGNDRTLDGGNLLDERRLYYRELVARFSHHLALNWNIGEENRNSDASRKEFAAYIKHLDPYKHPVVLHTYDAAKEKVYSPLLGSSDYTGASLQSSILSAFNDTLKWRQESAKASMPWIVTVDQQIDPDRLGIVVDGAEEDPQHDLARAHVLWGNFMAGGAGVEYYFGNKGNESDLTSQNYRTRELLYKQSKIAVDFFHNNGVPFWNMKNANERVSSGWCLSDSSHNVMVVYLNDATEAVAVDLDGSDDAVYSVKWYNPEEGGQLQNGSIDTILAGKQQNLGTSPFASPDAVALIQRVWASTDETDSPTASLTMEPTTAPTTFVLPLFDSFFDEPIDNTQATPTMSPSKASIPQTEIPTVEDGATDVPTSIHFAFTNFLNGDDAHHPSSVPTMIDNSGRPSMASSQAPTITSSDAPTVGFSDSPTSTASMSPSIGYPDSLTPSSSPTIRTASPTGYLRLVESSLPGQQITTSASATSKRSRFAAVAGTILAVYFL